MLSGGYKDFKSSNQHYELDIDELRQHRAKNNSSRCHAPCLSPEEQIRSINAKSPNLNGPLLPNQACIASKQQLVSRINGADQTKSPSSSQVSWKVECSIQKQKEEESMWRKETKTEDTASDLKRADSIFIGAVDSTAEGRIESYDELRTAEEGASACEHMKMFSNPRNKHFLLSKKKSYSCEPSRNETFQHRKED